MYEPAIQDAGVSGGSVDNELDGDQALQPTPQRAEKGNVKTKASADAFRALSARLRGEVLDLAPATETFAPEQQFFSSSDPIVEQDPAFGNLEQDAAYGDAECQFYSSEPQPAGDQDCLQSDNHGHDADAHDAEAYDAEAYEALPATTDDQSEDFNGEHQAEASPAYDQFQTDSESAYDATAAGDDSVHYDGADDTQDASVPLDDPAPAFDPEQVVHEQDAGYAPTFEAESSAESLETFGYHDTAASKFELADGHDTFQASDNVDDADDDLEIDFASQMLPEDSGDWAEQSDAALDAQGDATAWTEDTPDSSNADADPDSVHQPEFAIVDEPAQDFVRDDQSGPVYSDMPDAQVAPDLYDAPEDYAVSEPADLDATQFEIDDADQQQPSAAEWNVETEDLQFAATGDTQGEPGLALSDAGGDLLPEQDELSEPAPEDDGAYEPESVDPADSTDQPAPQVMAQDDAEGPQVDADDGASAPQDQYEFGDGSLTPAAMSEADMVGSVAAEPSDIDDLPASTLESAEEVYQEQSHGDAACLPVDHSDDETDANQEMSFADQAEEYSDAATERDALEPDDLLESDPADQPALEEVALDPVEGMTAVDDGVAGAETAIETSNAEAPDLDALPGFEDTQTAQAEPAESATDASVGQSALDVQAVIADSDDLSAADEPETAVETRQPHLQGKADEAGPVAVQPSDEDAPAESGENTSEGDKIDASPELMDIMSSISEKFATQDALPEDEIADDHDPMPASGLLGLGGEQLGAEFDESRTDPEAGEAARMLLDIMSQPSGAAQPQERALAADTLLRLVTKIPVVNLIGLSERICMMEQPPVLLVNKLIRHPDIRVSGPLLEGCSALSDQVLMPVVKVADNEKRRMIARRLNISAALSDALLEHGDASVLLTIVRNPGAALSHDAFGALSEHAKNQPSLQAPLVTRGDTPAPTAFELFWFLPSELRRYVLSRFLTDSETLNRILRIAQSVDENADADVVREPKTADKRSIESLVAAIEAGSSGEAADLLSDLAGINRPNALRIISDPDGEPLSVAMKAIGISRAQFLDAMSRWQSSSGCLIRNERPVTELQNLFESLSFNKARVLLTYWDWAAIESGPYARKAA